MPSPSDERPCEDSWRFEALAASLGGDDVLAAELVAVFLAEAPALLAAVRAAVDARDAEALRQTAHALKGAVGNFTTGGAYAAAAALERLGRGELAPSAPAALAALEREMTALRACMQADAGTDGSWTP